MFQANIKLITRKCTEKEVNDLIMSEKAPLVTIVTPTFEKFDKIYCTIDSVLKQNYCNIEFILSDDASKAFPEA